MFYCSALGEQLSTTTRYEYDMSSSANGIIATSIAYGSDPAIVTKRYQYDPQGLGLVSQVNAPFEGMQINSTFHGNGVPNTRHVAFTNGAFVEASGFLSTGMAQNIATPFGSGSFSYNSRFFNTGGSFTDQSGQTNHIITPNLAQGSIAATTTNATLGLTNNETTNFTPGKASSTNSTSLFGVTTSHSASGSESVVVVPK